MRVLVVGAGRMGSQIGTEYAIGGHTVTFRARDLAATERRVEQSLEIARGLGLPTDDPVRARGIRTTIPHEAPGNFDLMVESLPEDLALKASILRPLVERQPNAAIATNTSSLSVGELGDELGAPERTLGTHYWNPPLSMPLVEVIPGPHTRLISWNGFAGRSPTSGSARLSLRRMSQGLSGTGCRLPSCARLSGLQRLASLRQRR